MNVHDLISELRNADEVSTFVRNAAADRLEALLSSNDEGVTVKALEWEDVTISKPYWGAQTPLGKYQIQHRRFSTWWVRFDGVFLTEASSLEEAKAAAQADYERRILSALSTKPEAVKPRYIGTIGHVDHGKTSLTAAIASLATQPPTPASGEQMKVVTDDFEEAASYLKRIAEEVPRGHESVARGRSTYNWLTHCAKLLRSNSTTTAEDAGPVKKPYSGNPYDIPYTKVPEDWDDLDCLPGEDHHAYVKGWKQGLKEAEQIAVEMRKVHGSSTGDAYRCGAWDQGVRIAAAIRNTADSRNVAAPTPASGEQMERFRPGGKYTKHMASDPNGQWVTFDAAQNAITAANERAERAERERDEKERQWIEVLYDYRKWNQRAEAAEALNTTLSEALSNLMPPDLSWKEKGHGLITITVRKEDLRAARTALAALPAKQGGHGDV